MKGLAPQTALVLNKISSLDCLSPFILVGGTALALQIGNRQSEDLDFMRWRTSKNEVMDVNWPLLKDDLQSAVHVDSFNLMGFDHVEFVCEGVKLSFYAAGRYSPPVEPIMIVNRVVAADVKAIGVMKLETMSRRSNFRDYYDLYCILKKGFSLREMVGLAVEHSGHLLKTKNLLSVISDGSRFKRDSHFEQLHPLYEVTPLEIEQFVRQQISTEF